MWPEKGQFSCFKLKNSISILLTLCVTAISTERARSTWWGGGQDWEHWSSGGMGDSSSNIFLPSGSQVAYCKKAGLYFLIPVPEHLTVPTSALALCLQCWRRGCTGGASPVPRGSRWKPVQRTAGKPAVGPGRELQQWCGMARAQHWQAQRKGWCSTTLVPFQ